MDKLALLFDGFYYGMTRDEIAQRLHIPDSHGQKERLLTAPEPVNFIALSWEESFYLDNESRLREVILTRKGEGGDSLEILNENLIKTDWLPVAAERDNAVFDIFEHRNGDAAEKTDLDSFEREAIDNGQNITIYFFPAAFAQKCLKNVKIKFWANAVDKASENFCLLSLMKDSDYIKISFTAPLLTRKDALKYGQMIKR